MLLRRTARVGAALGAVVVVAGAFTLGLVAGHGTAPDAAEPSTGVLDDAADHIVDSSLLPVDRQALDDAAIKAMLTTAGDEWGSRADGTSAAGSYAGVGLWLRPEGSTLVVSQIATGSPAATSGVAVGAVLKAVNGHGTLAQTPAEVAAALRGPAGTTVSLLVRQSGTDTTLTLTRAQVSALEVTSSLQSGIGRIVVPAFSTGTGRQVRDAVASLHQRGAHGLVLDLRGNPGGLLTEAVETASAFLDGGTVVTYTRRDAAPTELDAVGSADTRTPLVVLVDGGTASAAEVVTGALQDRGRAVVVGSRTFGKGSVQEPTRLSDGSVLDLTVAHYALPSGRSVDGIGLEPDIEVVSADPLVALRRADEVLDGLQADAGGRG